MSATADSQMDTLLAFLKDNRGFDFTGYKRSTLERRIEKRMQAVGITTHAEYTDHLEVHPEEFQALFDTILINVTAFFRDPETWDHLRDHVLPMLVERRAEAGSFRVWCAGCASGQEAYSVAILLAELLGEERAREWVKIYATDADDGALDEARAASYTAKQIESVPEALREKYFEARDDRFQFRTDLRRMVIFGRNDLVKDAPISRVDLLLCRNTLMYFNADAQAEILGRFHFALRADGALVLGRSEMLVRHGELFEPLDMRSRTFSKVPRANMRDRLRIMARDAQADGSGASADALRNHAFDQSHGAQIIVDAEGVLCAVNADGRELFSLTEADLGRPVQDLELSYRPVELRLHLERVASDLQPVRLDELATRDSRGEEHVYEVRLAPLVGADEGFLGTAITFLDVTARHTLQTELEHSKDELGNAYEELQSTVEELETTNEELQSTNEELETTNEELQSSNEELEAMNEELQSTNEELETMNEELRQRTVELDEVNAFLETILTAMGMAIAVLDRKGVVQVWNSHATDLWGLRADEAVGQHFLVLDIGLPVEDLKGALKIALSGKEPRVERTLSAANRRGRAIECAVTLLPLSDGKEPNGAIVLMAEVGAKPAKG
ncbi:MAG: methyltransferase, CheR-type with sensor [Solirubrobacteraceae bacterium]|nr:methyltransferase, CheR-type with sensor [Solirubrobacteraceae bacterium]